MLSEHYHREVSELSVIAYAQDLAHLTPEELDAAIVEARRTSEYMPVSATIRAAHEKMRSTGENTYLGPPLLHYPEITPEEREEALKFSQKLKEQLLLDKKTEAPPMTPTPQKKIVMPRQSTLSIAEQKEILRKRGFLP